MCGRAHTGQRDDSFARAVAFFSRPTRGRDYPSVNLEGAGEGKREAKREREKDANNNDYCINNEGILLPIIIL